MNTDANQFQEQHFLILVQPEAKRSEYMRQDIFTKIEEAYFEVRQKFAGSLAALAPNDAAGRVTHTSTESNFGAEASVLKHMQLPKIALPNFSGDQLAWEGFRDLFRSLVHDISTISKVQKLQYLKSSLMGEAADAVDSVPLTDDAYQGAWEDLLARYDNPRILLYAHMRNLLACPGATAKASPGEIKRLLGVTMRSLRAFKSLARPVEHWDDWVVHLLVSKLDSTTRVHWETSLANSRVFPTFKELHLYLENRIHALEAAHPETTLGRSAPTVAGTPKRATRVSSNANTTTKSKGDKGCSMCQSGHLLSYCPKFKAMAVDQRGEHVTKVGLCCNCMRSGHAADACPHGGRCLVCGAKHHTRQLLHGGSRAGSRTGDRKPSSVEIGNASQAGVSALTMNTGRAMLLATAEVVLQGPTGETRTVRALLDSGSEASFVTEWVAQSLRLRRTRVDVVVAGLQGTRTGAASASVRVVLRSRTSPAFEITVNAYVLRTLTNIIPARHVSGYSWPHIQGLQLADPHFGVPTKIDVILGADVYGQVLRPGVRHGISGTPTAQLTSLDWVLVGTLSHGDEEPGRGRVSVHHAQARDELATVLRQFWELEDVGSSKPLSPEEEQAERHFARTHSRDSTGRYVVRLPRRDGPCRLGASRPAALAMLLSTERRQARQPELQQKYNDFLTEYLALEHMEIAPRGSPTPKEAYYMPHHAVFKASDPRSKVRVVFNASARTASGHSLNDCLLPGPRLQADLWLIITRWRMHRVGFLADIVKMFRQIRVHPEDADLQRIVWRAELSGEVRDFRLLTVTYGTASAPFLALRTLRQLAQDEGTRFPEGATALLRHSYVDDILTGARNQEEARGLQSQLVALLRAGGFALSKWASNSPSLCITAGQEECALPVGEVVSALGIKWDPAADTLTLRVASSSEHKAVTKREALSEVARLFDPLGWVAPVLVFGKIFIQDLWLRGSGWDETLDAELESSWVTFRSALQALDGVRIPRWIQTGRDGAETQIHGFSDASERAYAAVLYLRVVDSSGRAVTRLLAARTKVAPVKTQSVPRLELCGAVLLAKLLDRAIQGLDLSAVPVFAWTDAQVVLAWIRSHASKWKPFIAHRVSEIQTTLPSARWSYVQTAANPADLATRGISPADLLSSELWWCGPSWLQLPQASWPCPDTPPRTNWKEEERGISVLTAQIDYDNEILARFSSLTRLLRVTTYCFRFVRNSRGADPRVGGFLTRVELEASLLVWVRHAQLCFCKESEALKAGLPISAKSPLRTLQPILDGQGLLRVGGRLQASLLSYAEQHPLILPKTGRFSWLVVREVHLATLHGAPQLTRSHLLRKYWVVQGALLTRRVVRQCVRCARFRQETGQQRIGQLLSVRLRPSRPFLTSGIDFAGPIRVRASGGRGRTSTKGYICPFICLATRAIHLEAVSELTTAAFIAAYRRFISRRGRCAELLSDNGTNFRGAAQELKQMLRAASAYAPHLANEGTTWRFIPPHAPHFGGIWEAGVRSTKYHLRRIVADHALTYEELSTVLCQIEACLNSRPLHPLSSDPSDLTALTPGHFLVGEALTCVPEPLTSEDSASPLNRWRLLTSMRDHFWRRWTKEYLHHLQQSSMWLQSRTNLQVGTLVLIKDELLPPARWAMGRVVGVFPGPDGLVRVADVRTASSILRRPVTKLCPLPVVTDQPAHETTVRRD